MSFDRWASVAGSYDHETFVLSESDGMIGLSACEAQLSDTSCRVRRPSWDSDVDDEVIVSRKFSAGGGNQNRHIGIMLSAQQDFLPATFPTHGSAYSTGILQ